MKHAGQDALDRLEPLLQSLRPLPSLVEKKCGVFYRTSKAYLHFHEEPTGMHADVRVGEDFERHGVETKEECATFLKLVQTHVRP